VAGATQVTQPRLLNASPPTSAVTNRASSIVSTPAIRAFFLHSRPTPAHFCTTSTLSLSAPYSLLLPSAVRTMASKASLKMAEDFLTFVNASPTRELSPQLPPKNLMADKDHNSLPCREISKRPAREGRIQADQGRCSRFCPIVTLCFTTFASPGKGLAPASHAAFRLPRTVRTFQRITPSSCPDWCSIYRHQAPGGGLWKMTLPIFGEITIDHLTTLR